MALNLNNYKRISGLTAKADLDANDVFAVDNASDASTQKVSYSTLRTLLHTYFKLGTLSSGQYIEANSYAADLGILDTQLYTQRGLISTVLADIAPVQTSSTATQAFTAGSYLIYSNQLYIVTADIASGGTIAVGTNVAAVTVGSALITTAMMLAGAYNSSTTYAVGDVVTRTGNLYVCTGSTTGSWDSTKWSNITIADLLDDIFDELDALDIGIENFASEYSSSSTYSLGKYCIHDKKLYKCTTAISPAESWNSAHWTAVKVTDLIGNLNSLGTDNKTNLVSAINEANNRSEYNKTSIGTLSSLTTDDHDDLVEAINEVNAKAKNISDKYSASSTYDVGDLCIYNNKLYKCTTAITTAEAWNSNHWTATTLADEIRAIGFRNQIVVTLSGITSLPKTFNVTGITAAHELVQDGYALITPESSVGSQWSLVTGNGTVQVTGTFSGNTSTSIKATFGIPVNKVTGVAQ